MQASNCGVEISLAHNQFGRPSSGSPYSHWTAQEPTIESGPRPAPYPTRLPHKGLYLTVVSESHGSDSLPLCSAKELWDKLEQLYTETSLPSKLFLLEKIFRYKLDLSKNIEENLDDFTKLIQDIKLTGDKNIDDYTPIVLLNAIPDAYGDVKAAIKYLAGDLAMMITKIWILGQGSRFMGPGPRGDVDISFAHDQFGRPSCGSPYSHWTAQEPTTESGHDRLRTRPGYLIKVLSNPNPSHSSSPLLTCTAPSSRLPSHL
ncbi:hypothetical protein Sango_1592800 [Sesamum angolense]|uniref:Uncharacterized protein n=1 Tax=Sesamum angolense TaxID=2727404 RepID=A0AAE2BTW0_9LAMI|nr:hypothetical protein Sango_1592800 [Sesamum angolense]